MQNPLYSFKEETAWTVPLTDFQKAGSQQHCAMFGSERIQIQSCYLRGEVGGVFGTAQPRTQPVGDRVCLLLSETSQSIGWNDPEIGKIMNRGFDFIAALYLSEALVECWLMMAWGITFPSLALVRCDLWGGGSEGPWRQHENPLLNFFSEQFSSHVTLNAWFFYMPSLKLPFLKGSYLLRSLENNV